MSGLFASVFKLVGELFVEKDHRLPHRHTALGAAEGQHIHSGPPGQLFRVNLKCRYCVRKARTIHVQFEVEPLGQTVDLDQFIWSVEGAQLRGLGDREDLGLGVVNVGTSLDGVFNFVKVNLTVVTSNR